MVYSLPQVIHLHGNNNWITFQHFDGLIVQGTGSLHGQGQKWWQMVEYVTVRRANFYTTENGLRIKTWQGGHGYARYIRFERISFSESTAVETSNILYNDLRGTINSEIAVELLCSKSVPCKNIRMKDIQLEYGINGKIYEGRPKSHCLSVVQGWDEGNVYP
ncbi:hypothetical protein Gohar_021500, partial [Gossypium harknessii]|nr:hypothetical protein [Gossypium harknessii]